MTAKDQTKEIVDFLLPKCSPIEIATIMPDGGSTNLSDIVGLSDR